MTLVLIGDDHAPLLVTREPEGVARREDVLRDMLFEHPDMLPVREIDPAIGKLIAVAKELVIPDVGRIDALLVDQLGRLVIVECKLWRNPQARREVVGQILDYARELARFDYEDLQRQISIATKRQGNVLFDLIRESGAEVDEAWLVDRVARDLRAGRFLLLIVGDGITEGTHRIGEYLQHAGLAFDFGMIEMAQYRIADPLTDRERIIVQPRLVARTALIERIVIRTEGRDLVVDDMRQPAPVQPQRSAGAPVSDDKRAAWSSFVERFQNQVTFDDPGQPLPRSGGFNWMKLALPGPSQLTIWRSNGEVGTFIAFRGSEGLARLGALAADREAIDQEFLAAGLDRPTWTTEGDERSIALSWPSPLPWDDAEERRQIMLLGKAANQFANSIRARAAVE